MGQYWYWNGTILVLEWNNTVPEWDNTVPEWDNTVPEWDNTVPEWDNTVPEWDNTGTGMGHYWYCIESSTLTVSIDTRTTCT